MNKRLIVTAVFAVCGGAMLASPAFAQTGTGTQAQSQTATTANTTPAASGKHAVPPLDSRSCIRDTGSHIPPPKGQCLPVMGKSYSQKDIQNTGATNLGQALQMLDPSATTHGH